MTMFFSFLGFLFTLTCALETHRYKLLYLALAIILCGIGVTYYQDYEQNKLLQKSPNYITSTHMKNELDAWFLVAQNSHMLCNSRQFDNCDAFLIATDFTTLTNQQIEYINKGKVFNSICTNGFDNNEFYKQFPNYIGASDHWSIGSSAYIILNGYSKLANRDVVMLVFKNQFTNNCNLLYKSNTK